MRLYESRIASLQVVRVSVCPLFISLPTQCLADGLAGKRAYEMDVIKRMTMSHPQRAVAMFVMVHELGMRVQDFWPTWTLGYLGYDMSRTHSIMRIATNASRSHLEQVLFSFSKVLQAPLSKV